MEDPHLWWRNGIIYQIYPRSFQDQNGDGIGDLKGITKRLDYLADLGVNAIWLSPIYPSPDVDFGYDISDYQAIDPRFGTLYDFDELVQHAHQKNMRIVLDLVLNHTSDQHPWFQKSRSSLDNPYRDWYLWRSPKPNGSPPNNWRSMFGGAGWEKDTNSGQYYFHLFAKEQPDLNWRNLSVQEAGLDVVKFWLDRGVDGFRLDVFNAFFKQADFLDNPGKVGLRGFDRQVHINDIDQPALISFLGDLRSLLDAYPGRYAVGETFLSSPGKAARYCQDQMLHATFNFEFTKCRWDPRDFLKAIQDWEAALGGDNWPTYVLNNHDLPRTATRYSSSSGDDRLKAAAALLLTLRGTPFLYYGEEIGMRDISLRRKQIMDPPGKRYWPIYKGRDSCRSPMQWDTSPHAGFSQCDPWLPIHPDFSIRNVLSQRSNPDSLFNFYRRLIQIRKSSSALTSGDFIPLTPHPRQALAYLRKNGSERVLVAINFSRHAQTLVLEDEVNLLSWDLLLSNKRDTIPDLTGRTITLQPDEACLLGCR